eukprot:TRINITY_DN1654_c0_g1_i1.p1 TRINITY_DN1654_c0_g1~~TRINITY_DN1654_c0_g1_i1.p1  ORF type:complete len:456 (-),score=106.49 TRINITY_DN1654_c0_g1_i1:123-1454(-)
MGLGINLIRTETDKVKEAQKKRFKPVEVIDQILALDEKWRKAIFEIDEKRKQRSKVTKEISQKKRAKEECDDLIEQSKAIAVEISAMEKTAEELKEQRDTLVNGVGNLVHPSVPVSQDEEHNGLVRKWGEFKKKEEINLHHHELLHMIDGYDPERGVKVAGHRAYFLKDNAVLLNQALINFGINFLKKRDYTPIQTPFFMNRDMMAKTAQLEQFDEELYKVSGKGVTEPKYLIATSEQPISAFHAGEWLKKKELPLRYAGYSTNFRKEAGSHGKDTWGIFRVHQFEKIEQFVITEPDKSWEEHENMIKVSEDFFQALGLPYRVVTIVSGELNNAAAKKYDLEGWFPGYEQFRELVSCSNCTDYQSRSLEIRCGIKKKGDKTKTYVHMLNSTLTATERTMCCILENYQTKEGIVVPDVLQPYMGGVKLIPFVKAAPTNPESKGK